jgi:DNA repair protein RadD
VSTAINFDKIIEQARCITDYLNNAAERDRWHQMLTFIAIERGYKPGWIANKYKEKFGGWPPQRHVQPIEPDAKVSSWVKSRIIAYTKAAQKAAGVTEP